MRASAWAIAVILLPQIPPPAVRAGVPGDVSIVCHDLENVEVTWGSAPAAKTNLSLEFRYQGHAPQPCPHYVLLSGFTSGCVFPAGTGLLEVTVRDGGGAVRFTRRRRASAWLKPRPPVPVTFLWTQDATSVTVACPTHSYPGLDYEVQHRDLFDDEWQTTSAPQCNVTLVGMDPVRCYDFRVRATPQGFYYGSEALPSDWSPVTHWQGGSVRAGSCTISGPAPFPWPLPFACGLLTLLTLALLLALPRLRRVKEALLPCVPDPRGSFPGLFEKHRGNFQAWIADAQATAPMAKNEEEEEEDSDVIRPQGKGSEPEATPTSYHPKE